MRALSTIQTSLHFICVAACPFLSCSDKSDAPRRTEKKLCTGCFKNHVLQLDFIAESCAKQLRYILDAFILKIHSILIHSRYYLVFILFLLLTKKYIFSIFFILQCSEGSQQWKSAY